MIRRFQFSLGTFFWPTVVVVVYVAIGVVAGLPSGLSEAPGDVGVSTAPDDFRRDLAVFFPVSLAVLFLGTWLVVLLARRVRREYHMPRPQFTLRALLVLLLAVACFFGGIRFERARKRREDEARILALDREINALIDAGMRRHR